MYKLLYKSHKTVFNRLFMVDMACPRWRIILGRCWADVGPVGPTSGHWRPCFLGYLGHSMKGHYDFIAYCFLWICALCTHISMCCFICSLIIILCVIKKVQPTPLVVSDLVATVKRTAAGPACVSGRQADRQVLGEAGVAFLLDWTALDDRGWRPRGSGMAPPDKAPSGSTSWAPQSQSHQGDRSFAALHARAR